MGRGRVAIRVLDISWQYLEWTEGWQSDSWKLFVTRSQLLISRISAKNAPIRSLPDLSNTVRSGQGRVVIKNNKKMYIININQYEKITLQRSMTLMRNQIDVQRCKYHSPVIKHNVTNTFKFIWVLDMFLYHNTWSIIRFLERNPPRAWV